uniref:EF-hand domain-containing protein n=1 Tax=Zooxanthella nutricula TaxID=1333877 RepID=A0A7S2QJ19_9DINO
MNILHVLDVDGKGVIEKEVLKKSLKIFDPEVFTELGVEQLIHAATRGKEGADGACVRILDLALYMGSPVFLPIPPGQAESSSEDPPEDPVVEATPDGIILQEQLQLKTAEEFFLAALDSSEFASSCGGMLTARTDVDSTVNDPATAHVALRELQECGPSCKIPKPEMRGITLRQLRRLMHYVEEHCERESWYDPETGAPLTPDKVDLYCLTEWVLKPATRDRRCSFVELIATKASEQRPTWYVSHGAGPVSEFYTCLIEHATRHGFGDDVAYWVDAYANNLWMEPAGDDTWAKALAVSQGTVQIIGSGPVAYLEVGSHSLHDVDTDPFYGVRAFL